MRNSKYTHITVGGVDYSAYARLPLTIQRTLNEQLDSAVVDLFNMPFREPLKPFDLVTVGDETYILAEDTVTEVMGRGLYKHSLTLLEQTKETERIICGAKAFTRPLVKDYAGWNDYVSGWFVEPYNGESGKLTYRVLAGEKAKADAFVSPINGKTVTLYKDTFGWLAANPGLSVKSYGIKIAYIGGRSPINLEYDNHRLDAIVFDESAIVYNKNVTPTSSDVLGTYTLSGFGVCAVIYEIVFSGSSNKDTTKTFVFEVSLAEKAATKDAATIADVVTTLLKTSETLRKGDSPRYALSEAVAGSPVMKQEAPEFRFSNGRSLWENLREIGRYIHAIPRVKGNELTFDDLGGVEYADLSKGQRIAQTSYLNVGEYTAGLDSMANNLINQDDPTDGNVTEPYENGYITMRAAAEEARIAEGTGLLATAHPVEKVIKLELAPFGYDDKQYPATDLTAYVFEKQEYDLLSSFTGIYPTSKTYAIYYTQGGKNIEGFWFKAQDTGSDILNSMQEYSITNIIERATGVATGYFNQLDYTSLAYRITYIPSVTARVRQYKPDYDGAFPSVMVYNQSANKLSARAFGENLRGQLAMIGTITDSVTYMFQRVEDIPKPGTLYNDTDYISAVTARIYNDFVLAQIDLSTGYNEIGAYVETPNAIRQFEIPASEDRYTVLEEFCVVSNEKAKDEDGVAATAELKKSVMDAFKGSTTGKDASLAVVQTYNGEKPIGATLALPVVSLAIGNSLYFGFRFEDNYSAGRKSVASGEQFRYQELVPYADKFYAEAEYIGFKLMASTGNTLGDHNLLPELGNEGGTAMVDLGDKPIEWYKDSADAGCITYQLHFISDAGFIIGDGLAHFCTAVRKRTSTGEARIYFYNHRIHQLTGTTDTDGAIASNAIGFDEENGRIFVVGQRPESFKSWAIIKNGRFVLGKNTTEATPSIYFNFKRRYKS